MNDLWTKNVITHEWPVNVVCRRADILFTLFVFICIVVSNTYCVVFFCFVCLVLSVHNTASFSELSILNCPFSILQCLFKTQNANYLSRTDHLTCRGRLWLFVSFRILFLDNTRVLIYEKIVIVITFLVQRSFMCYYILSSQVIRVLLHS
jgi:hypothetical protein